MANEMERMFWGLMEFIIYFPANILGGGTPLAQVLSVLTLLVPFTLIGIATPPIGAVLIGWTLIIAGVLCLRFIPQVNSVWTANHPMH